MCIFVSYPFRKKGWKFYDLENGDMFVSTDVISHEKIFPFVTDTNKEETHSIVNHKEQFCGICDDDRLVLASRTS